MVLTQHNPEALFPPYANYAHAVEVAAGSRLLFISGLNGYESDGSSMPDDFGSGWSGRPDTTRPLAQSCRDGRLRLDTPMTSAAAAARRIRSRRRS